MVTDIKLKYSLGSELARTKIHLKIYCEVSQVLIFKYELSVMIFNESFILVLLWKCFGIWKLLLSNGIQSYESCPKNPQSQKNTFGAPAVCFRF